MKRNLKEWMTQMGLDLQLELERIDRQIKRALKLPKLEVKPQRRRKSAHGDSSTSGKDGLQNLKNNWLIEMEERIRLKKESHTKKS